MTKSKLLLALLGVSSFVLVSCDQGTRDPVVHAECLKITTKEACDQVVQCEWFTRSDGKEVCRALKGSPDAETP